MWSLRIVILPQVMMMMMIVMMTRPPRRRVMQVLLYNRSLLSLTLHHASISLSLLLPLTLLVAHPLLPHLVVMVSLVMPH
jgi:hypothetical protein